MDSLVLPCSEWVFFSEKKIVFELRRLLLSLLNIKRDFKISFFILRSGNGASTFTRWSSPSRKSWSSRKTGEPRPWAASSRASGWRATQSTRPPKSLFALLTESTSPEEVRPTSCPRPLSASVPTRHLRACRPPESASCRWDGFKYLDLISSVSRMLTLKNFNLFF